MKQNGIYNYITKCDTRDKRRVTSDDLSALAPPLQTVKNMPMYITNITILNIYPELYTNLCIIKAIPSRNHFMIMNIFGTLLILRVVTGIHLVNQKIL